jgi:hypothetical protein
MNADKGETRKTSEDDLERAQELLEDAMVEFNFRSEEAETAKKKIERPAAQIRELEQLISHFSVEIARRE